MRQLEQRISREATVLPGNILKIDGFLNHQVDIAFCEEMAEEFYRHFAKTAPTKILTVEASGIVLAAMTARRFSLPMLFAKKAKSDNIEGGLYRSEIFSYTYNKKATLLVAQNRLDAGERVLVIDDFLARGEALRGLIDIVSQAGATLCGVGIAVEKGFQGGGDALRAQGVDLLSLAIIDSMQPNEIVFRELD